MEESAKIYNRVEGRPALDPIPPEESESVEYDRDGPVSTVTLSRPDRLNAVTPALYAGVLGALDRADEDGAHVIVLTGAGRAFCAGADLKEHDAGERTPAEKRAYAWAAQHACRRIQTQDRPVIAAVNGYAIGAGAELALSADLIVMAESAEMRFPELALGTYIGGGLTYTLPDRVGRATAKELVLTAAHVPGPSADEMGLADRVAADDAFEDAVADLAETIANNAPIPVGLATAHLSRPATDPDLALTAEVEGLLTCMETGDWQEGLEAFAEDREPHFEGM